VHVQPDEGLSLAIGAKMPGQGMSIRTVHMDFLYGSAFRHGLPEAYERLILDAMRGDHTLFTTAEGIERLWEVSQPLLDDPPPVRPYAVGSWGPNAIHQLIAPYAWRLPFERVWRESHH